jgi:acyl-coenzyme A synthetase/AMP-(fatty) acid ligase
LTPAPLDAVLAERARRLGDRVYLIGAEDGRGLTFAALEAACRGVARLLAARGVRPRDRVSILGDNGPALVALLLGIQRAGAVANPLDAAVHATNVADALHAVAPRLVFASRRLPAELRAVVDATGVESIAFSDEDLETLPAVAPSDPTAPPPVGPDDLAIIHYTSGTTARPKGVCIGRAAFSFMAAAPAERFAITAADRVLEYRSLAWASPQLLGLGATLHAGATLVLAPRFSRRRFFHWIAEHRVTIAAGVPTVIGMLLERPLSPPPLPSLRFLTSSAAPLPPAREREFERRYGVPIVQGCGMTEAGFMAGNPPEARRVGSIGLPMPRVEAWFADDAGNRRPPGHEGELVVRGPQMAAAYLVGRGALEPITRDGLRTGDLGYADADGYLYLTGRKKDVIIKGGVNIAPLEITAVLLEHPAVADAATIGLADRIYGEAIGCAVALRPGVRVGSDELLQHCRRRLSPFKMPMTVAIVERIPRNAHGKIAADALRRVLTGASAPPP